MPPLRLSVFFRPMHVRFFCFVLFFCTSYFVVSQHVQPVKGEDIVNFLYYELDSEPSIGKELSIDVFYRLSEVHIDVEHHGLASDITELTIISTITPSLVTNQKIIIDPSSSFHIVDYVLTALPSRDELRLTLIIFPRNTETIQIAPVLFGEQKLLFPAFFVFGFGDERLVQFNARRQHNDSFLLLGLAFFFCFAGILTANIFTILARSNTLFINVLWLLANSINFISCNFLLLQVSKKVNRLIKKHEDTTKQSDLSLYHYLKLHTILIKRLVFIFGEEIKAFTAQELYALLKKNNFVQRDMDSKVIEFFRTYNIVMYGSDFIGLDHRSQDTQLIAQILFNTRIVSKTTVISDIEN